MDKIFNCNGINAVSYVQTCLYSAMDISSYFIAFSIEFLALFYLNILQQNLYLKLTHFFLKLERLSNYCERLYYKILFPLKYRLSIFIKTLF